VVGAADADVEATSSKETLGKLAAEHDAPEKCPVDFEDGDDPTVCSHWALLVAGSSGWGNYRLVGLGQLQQWHGLQDSNGCSSPTYSFGALYVICW
jgi:hypothetical protein